MQPVINIALRAARQANEYIEHTLGQIEYSDSDRSKNAVQLQKLQEVVYKIFFDALKKAYPKHYIANQGEWHVNEKEHSWHISYFHSPENLMRKLPATGYSVVYKIKGKIEHAILVNPITGEEYAASRGHGASLNGKRIRALNTTDMSHSKIGSNLLSAAQKYESRHLIDDLAINIHQCSAGLQISDCYVIDIANVAAGKIEAAVLDQINIDDASAALLLCQEAGTLSGNFKGAPTSSNSKQLVIANPRLFKSLVQRTHTVADKAI